MSVAVSGNGRIQMILKDPLQLAISMNMNMESNTAGAGPDVTMQDQVSVQEWMQDGWVYIQEEMDGTTDRYKYPVGNMDGFAEFYQEMLQISGQRTSMILFLRRSGVLHRGLRPGSGAGPACHGDRKCADYCQAPDGYADGCQRHRR